jgi:hypothetical protein
MATLVDRVVDLLSKKPELVPLGADNAIKGTVLAERIAPELVGTVKASIQASISAISTNRMPVATKSDGTFVVIRKAGGFGYFRQIENGNHEDPPPNDEEVKKTDDKENTPTGKQALPKPTERDPERESLEEKFRALMYINDEHTSDSANVFPLVLKHDIKSRALVTPTFNSCRKESDTALMNVEREPSGNWLRFSKRGRHLENETFTRAIGVSLVTTDVQSFGLAS